MEELKRSWNEACKHRNNTEKLSRHFFRTLARSNLREGKALIGDDESIDITRKQFHEEFGGEGIKILTNLMTSRALNGGKARRNVEGYFSGVEYSMAVGFYAMDRALSHHNTSAYRERAYKQFVEDVSRMWSQTKRTIEGDFVPMPTQKRLQDICRPKLKQLEELRGNRKVRYNNSNEFVSPAPPDHMAS